MAKNISMLEKTLWKRKDPKEPKTIGTPQKKLYELSNKVTM